LVKDTTLMFSSVCAVLGRLLPALRYAKLLSLSCFKNHSVLSFSSHL